MPGHDARCLFEKHGLRCTRQRLAIYEALASTKTHPSPEELFAAVEPMCLGLSLATVYNTLEAFCQAGLCQRLPVTTGSSRYDADVSSHLHLVNRETGEIRDVPRDLGDAILHNLPFEVIRDLEDRMGVSIDRVAIGFFHGTA